MSKRDISHFKGCLGAAPDRFYRWDPTQLVIVGGDDDRDEDSDDDNRYAQSLPARMRSRPDPEFVLAIEGTNQVDEPVQVAVDGRKLVVLDGRRRARAARRIWYRQKAGKIPEGDRVRLYVHVHQTGSPDALANINLGSHFAQPFSSSERQRLRELIFENGEPPQLVVAAPILLDANLLKAEIADVEERLRKRSLIHFLDEIKQVADLYEQQQESRRMHRRSQTRSQRPRMVVSRLAALLHVDARSARRLLRIARLAQPEVKQALVERRITQLQAHELAGYDRPKQLVELARHSGPSITTG